MFVSIVEVSKGMFSLLTHFLEFCDCHVVSGLVFESSGDDLFFVRGAVCGAEQVYQMCAAIDVDLFRNARRVGRDEQLYICCISHLDNAVVCSFQPMTHTINRFVPISRDQ